MVNFSYHLGNMENTVVPFYMKPKVGQFFLGSWGGIVFRCETERGLVDWALLSQYSPCWPSISFSLSRAWVCLRVSYVCQSSGAGEPTLGAETTVGESTAGGEEKHSEEGTGVGIHVFVWWFLKTKNSRLTLKRKLEQDAGSWYGFDQWLSNWESWTHQ